MEYIKTTYEKLHVNYLNGRRELRLFPLGACFLKQYPKSRYTIVFNLSHWRKLKFKTFISKIEIANFCIERVQVQKLNLDM